MIPPPEEEIEIHPVQDNYANWTARVRKLIGANFFSRFRRDINEIARGELYIEGNRM